MNRLIDPFSVNSARRAKCRPWFRAVRAMCVRCKMQRIFVAMRNTVSLTLLLLRLTFNKARERPWEECMTRLASPSARRKLSTNSVTQRSSLGFLMIASAVAALASFSAASAQSPAKGSPEHIKAVTSAVDQNSIKANTATSNDWPTVGLDYGETRFSKLNQLNTDNVKNLGLVWSYNLESSRGVEATPIVVDGIMYVTASWSVVHAIDVRTGKQIWTFDPEVPRSIGYKGCCDVVNRGVALHKGKIFVGAYDGRLIALDAVTGKKVWEKDTLIDKEHSYTITGARAS